MEQTPSPPLLEFINAGIQLGGQVIQKGITFSLYREQFVAVLGPNGAGKSTLLKLILGLLKPTSGQIRLFGETPRTGNRRIGYTPQFSSLEASLTLRARDIVGFGLDGHRWGMALPNKMRAAKITRALEEVDGLHLAEASFSELSGGERQRLLIAQALLSDPELLLLDEPLASLDMSHAQEMVALVDRIRRTRGTAVLFVTHDVNPVLPCLDKVLYLAGGQSTLGTVQDVITTDNLSRLYGSRVEVLQSEGRLFVLGVDT